MDALKVLVIGRTGMLARCLAEVRSPDVTVVTVGRPELDLRDEASIARAVERAAPDVLINAAAYTAVDKAESEPDLAFALNAEGPANIARVASRFGCPLIHVSTDYVFDGSKPGAYSETDATNPLGVYGRTKLAGEIMVAAAHDRHIIVRTSWLHAPVGANFVRTILRLAEIRPEIRVVADQFGSPTYAPHLAASLVGIARVAVRRDHSGLRPWGVYHAAGAGETTWFDLAREVLWNAAKFDLPLPAVTAIRTEDYPTAAARPANSRLDSSRLAATLGFRLPDWRAGVADCVRRLAGDSSVIAAPHALASAGEVR